MSDVLRLQHWTMLLVWTATLGLSGCSSSNLQDQPTTLNPEQLARSGGDLTVYDTSRDAFNRPAPNLLDEHLQAFAVGNSLVRRTWVAAPSSTEGLDGLGPLFNAANCTTCHVRDGRGHPPRFEAEPVRSLLVRLSIPGISGPVPEPHYGEQFQNLSIQGVAAEGDVVITYDVLHGTYADGTGFELRRPHIDLQNLAYGPLHSGVMMSARVAPAMIGMGLLEHVPISVLIKLADPNDINNDGISGRVHQLNLSGQQGLLVGRFGWKAAVPTVEQQVAGALHGDMGLTTRIFPEPHCQPAQADCLNGPHGGTPEVDDLKLARMTLYSKTLGVPARRYVQGSTEIFGEQLFQQAGCTSCHTAQLRTDDQSELEELRHQTFRPYTDLLLHDMGEGLSDGRPDLDATGAEWRTAPLWGLGLIQTVNGHLLLLHDGRARGIEEAILWHGGEAEASRERFRTMPAQEREALIMFLESL